MHRKTVGLRDFAATNRAETARKRTEARRSPGAGSKSILAAAGGSESNRGISVWVGPSNDCFCWAPEMGTARSVCKHRIAHPIRSTPFLCAVHPVEAQ